MNCIRIPCLLFLAGCTAAPAWRDDLASARSEAAAARRPLLVLSLLGDLRKRCWLAAHALRAGTLSDPAVERELTQAFVLSTHNQLPALYCNDTVDATSESPYPPAHLAKVLEGAGGGNIRFYFCDPEGRVVHYVAGYWKPETLIAECRYAQALLAAPADAAESRAQRRSEVAAARDAETDRPRRAALSRILRSLDEAPVGRPIEQVLRDVEDDVYRKGAVG